MRLPRPAGAPQPGQFPTPGQTPGFQMTAGDVWRVIRANLWLIITLVVVAAAIGFVVNTLLAKYAPRYTATGVVAVQGAVLYDPLKQPIMNDQSGLPVEQRTQAMLLQSEQLFSAVLSKPNSQIRTKTTWFREMAGANGDNIERAKKDLEKNFDVAPMLETKLIKASMTYTVPADTQIIVQEIVDEHIRQQQELARNQQMSRSQVLSNMKEAARIKLGEVNRDLQQLQIKLSMGGGGEPGRLNSKEMELGELLRKQLELTEDVQMAKAKYESIDKAVQKGEIPPMITEYINRDQTVANARQQLDQIDMAYSSLSLSLGSENQRLQQLGKQKELAQQKLDGARAEAKANAEAMIVSALRDEAMQKQGQLDALEKRVTDVKEKQGELNNTLSTYLTRKEEAKGYQDAIQAVDGQLDTIAQVTSQQELSSVSWRQRPERPGTMSFPKLWLTLSVAVFLGLGMGLGIAFTREALDTTVRSPRDVARVGQLNLLGMVPDEQDDPQATGGRLPLIIFDAPHSIMSEQLRQIRARLQHAASLDTTRTIMVTSPSPGDGKTMIATNLAAGLALNGRKILLVDANFRRPELHKLFGVAAGTGFSEALANPDKFDAAVRVVQVPNLFVMPLGTKPGNPTELLESQLFGDFIERALKEYDHVIFDSGPLLLASDAMAVAPRVDGVVSVVRAQANSRGLLQRMRDALRQIKAEHVGVVLNGVRAQGGGYYGRNIKTYYAYQNGNAA
jgi:capsular exopolysaccharide synthesis family protein